MKKRYSLFIIIFFAATCLLGVSLFAAVSSGAKELNLPTVWAAVFHFNAELTSHQIIHELRLPRVLGAALVGCALAVSGALMQAVTRNDLADPGILGINAGASLMTALCFALSPGIPYSLLIVFCFFGSVISAICIFWIASGAPGGITPIRLTVAGAILAALFSSLSSGVAIYFDLSQDLAFWFAGGTAGIRWGHLTYLAPIILAAVLLSLSFARPLTLLSLGEETAAGLGGNVPLVRLAAIGAAVLLAGTSVSAAGSIGFIGLIVPHIARKLVGVDYRFIIPISALGGSILLVLADYGARMVNPPRELAISAMVALLGVPFFLFLSRRQRRRES
ncbi:iron ABC transporter permease [Domibacillus sp. PGB-M46]|uniref:FecCD family ABC transporter permease n=1 Tax=Domibacillus sp. PGB-M46 TaxID=2910255 RepID=UPI001F579439|nr:iron ABC transporter permease [Domibacillus sp. PGB-M46]MCI2255634.1 iron ABC transporter permease [Domibacillus sp. PGB-M46]